MSGNLTSEGLQSMGAQGRLGQVVSTTEQAIRRQASRDENVRFGGIGVVFQYLNALLRHRRDLGKFVVTFFEEMPADNPEATNEVLGDLLRSIALFFISLNRPRAARGAISWAIHLHKSLDSPEAPAKRFHDSLVQALIPIASGLPAAAKDRVQRVVEDIEFEVHSYSADLSSIERSAKYWLLLLKCVVNDNAGLDALATWVANNDASRKRRTVAETLGSYPDASKMRGRLARGEMEKELRGR